MDHPDGQAMGLPLPDTMHMSVRLGGLAERIRNRVYLPTTPGRVTNSLSVAPGRSNRPSRPRTRSSRVAGRPRLTVTREDTVCDTRLNGHPRPLHPTLTSVPGGASTVRRRMRAPRRETRPAIRTTGKGLSSGSACRPALVPGAAGVPTFGAAGVPTFSTAVATSVALVVTRSETV